MVLSILNLQEAYAKALLVDRDALRSAQKAGDVLGGHEVLLDAYKTDVRRPRVPRRARRSARPRTRSAPFANRAMQTGWS